MQLVREHTHSVNAAVTGLSALPITAQPFTSVLAMHRFLNHEGVTLPALIEPAQDAVRQAVAASDATVALLVHDWCMFNFNAHTRKTDRYQPRTTRTLNLGGPLVHVIDREADSVGHYQRWLAAGHSCMVRADSKRWVTWRENEVKLSTLATALRLQFRDVLDEAGRSRIVKTQQGTGRLQVVEMDVVLTRPAKTRVGQRQIEVPGPPLPLRLIVSQVVDELGMARAK